MMHEFDAQIYINESFEHPIIYLHLFIEMYEKSNIVISDIGAIGNYNAL